MKRTITHDNNHHSVDFIPERKSYVAPVIVESFLDDNGAMQHILESGNTLSDDNFIRMWGVPKGAILPKNYKGKDYDSRR